MSQSLLSKLKEPERLKSVHKRLSIAVVFVLVILCAQVLFQFYKILFVEDESTATIKNNPVKVVPDVNNQQAFKKLTEVNLFGNATEKKIKISKVPETKLDLVLKGVLAYTPMKNSTAFIASGKNAKDESYGVGDKLSDGVTIKEIYSDYVVLDRRGHFEILRMPESKSVGELVSVIPDLSDVMQVVDADMLDIVRNKIIAAPYTLRDYALPVVVKENSKQIGYRLQPLQHGYVLSDIGIEPDDVVTAVNDIRLNDPKNATRALRELITAKDVFITIKRGGDEISFKAKIQ